MSLQQSFTDFVNYKKDLSPTVLQDCISNAHTVISATSYVLLLLLVDSMISTFIHMSLWPLWIAAHLTIIYFVINLVEKGKKIVDKINSEFKLLQNRSQGNS
jgi:hypothetical protein